MNLAFRRRDIILEVEVGTAQALVHSVVVLPLSRSWPRRHPFLVDSLWALGLLVLSLSFRFRIEGEVPNPRLEVVLAFAMTLPLVFRRRYPTGVFFFIAAMALLQWSANVAIRPEDLAILVASYTVAAHGSRATAIGATAVVVAGVAMAVARWHLEEAIPAFMTLTALALAALVLGDDMRHRRAYLAELEDRAARLEREKEAETQMAVEAERANIARELHDIVAHHLSVMVIQSEGAEYAVGEDPAVARQAMSAVSETGRQALTEMRDLLAVLRPPEVGGLVPQPRLDQLEDLIDGVRQAGLVVDYRIVGEPRVVAAGIELAVYRIVQEALTNTLKHAERGASSAVEVAYEPTSVRARVTDTGTRGDRCRIGGAGQGLVGMRERAALYHGVLLAGPRPDGGFEVSVTFPAHGSA